MEDNLFNWRPKSAGDWVILLAGAGIMLTSPMGARFLIKELYKYISDRNKARSKKSAKITVTSLTQAMYYLKKRKLIKIESIGGKTVIKLTEKGMGRKLICDLENLTIRKPTEWDGKWRLVMFDIPEPQKAGRDGLRFKLKKMKFLQFQKSVWIFPYPCEKEIDFLAEALQIREHITLLTVQIEDDLPLRAKFSL